MFVEKASVLEYQRASAASDMFQLLALALNLPQIELAGGLLDGSVAEDTAALFAELGFDPQDTREIVSAFEAVASRGGSREELFSELRQEYTRLFCHPRKPAIPLYEALFRNQMEGQGEDRPLLFISPAALDAERCYQKAGLKMSTAVKESCDHLGIEMEFMMYLYLQKARAIQADDPLELASRVEQIEEFDRLHIQRWAPEFFVQCKTLSSSVFYRTIGEIGRLFLAGLSTRD
jgi:TorA maturation chaperone TorD